MWTSGIIYAWKLKQKHTVCIKVTWLWGEKERSWEAGKKKNQLYRSLWDFLNMSEVVFLLLHMTTQVQYANGGVHQELSLTWTPPKKQLRDELKHQHLTWNQCLTSVMLFWVKWMKSHPRRVKVMKHKKRNLEWDIEQGCGYDGQVFKNFWQ